VRRRRPFTARLERRRAADEAWQRYLADGTESPAVVGEHIRRSWRRTRDTYRIDPFLSRPGPVLSPDALRLRCQRDDVFRLARPVVAELAQRLELRAAVLAYLDGEGWMLSIDGDPRVVEQAGGVDFRPGAHWAEEVAGTNGPGTALAERQALEVFASEHFVATWHPWSCAAAPILAAGCTAPVGVVNISAPWDVQDRGALVLAKAIARAVEERLRAVANVRDGVVRYAFRAARETGDALVAVDARGRLVEANDAAVRRRLVGGLSPFAQELLAAVRSAGSDSDLRLETPEGRAFVASPVHHEGSVVGAILRIAPSAPARTARPTDRTVTLVDRTVTPTERTATPGDRCDLARVHGRSEPLRRALQIARMAARNDLPLLVSGEPGTGKELLARAIHGEGRRGGGPFVAVTCAAVPPLRAGGEPFGAGAGGGTLFLDEVCELPAEHQGALLRALQALELATLAGSAPPVADVRVIAASSEPLHDAMRAGRFRRDLYDRLAVLSIAVPPLRDRGEDVVLLARAFLADAEREVGRAGLTFSAAALEALRAHSWPGNVRELGNVVLRAAAIARSHRISARDIQLDGRPSDPQPAPGPVVGTLRGAVLDAERDALVAALDASGWNVVRAAARLGVSRTTIYRRLRSLGLSCTRATR
jgi:transcriptional regulator of acetoin/glycerol metabolism